MLGTVSVIPLVVLGIIPAVGQPVGATVVSGQATAYVASSLEGGPPPVVNGSSGTIIRAT